MCGIQRTLPATLAGNALAVCGPRCGNRECGGGIVSRMDVFVALLIGTNDAEAFVLMVLGRPALQNAVASGRALVEGRKELVTVFDTEFCGLLRI